jgi:RNA 2',3'-cyclic 3'-phosphodiesterase
MPRLFVAIDPPECIRDAISALNSAIAGARWMEDDQIHLTLKFIGEVDNPTENQIIHALKKLYIPPFTIILKGIGLFPPRKIPRILWIGVEENPILMRMQAQIERVLASINIEPDPRKFHPHITIARLNNAHQERIGQFIAENNLFCSEPFEVSEFYLYRSYLGKTGSTYVKEATFGEG